MDTGQPAEWIAALQGGDRQLFAALVRQHQRSVFFLAMRMSRGDEQLSRDIVQKSFLKAWARRQSFRGEASFKTWLLRIARNLTLNELARAWRRHEDGVVERAAGAGEVLGQVEAEADERLALQQRRELLQEALAELPPRQRTVALLRLYEELSFAEIAMVCEISENTAKVNFHHAVRNVRKYLDEKGVAA